MTIEQPQAFPAIDVQEVQRRLEQGEVSIVDTRPAFDFAGGRIPGSINLPGTSMKARKDQVPPGQALLLVAAEDDQAIAGCELARSLGFKVAGYVLGGFDAWADADYPVHTISDGMGMPAAPPADKA